MCSPSGPPCTAADVLPHEPTETKMGQILKTHQLIHPHELILILGALMNASSKVEDHSPKKLTEYIDEMSNKVW